MKVNLKYFGIVSEITGTNEELLDIDNNFSTEDLCLLLEEKYSNLNFADYRLAINESLINTPAQLAENDIVAILPPFSGG